MSKTTEAVNVNSKQTKNLYGELSEHEQALQLPIFKRCLERSGMSADSFVEALTQTSLSSLLAWTQSDLERLLLAAEALGLNPAGREIFLVPSQGLLGPPILVVGVDGWSRIINTHQQFAGMRFEESTELVDGVPSWIECTMFRWDRHVATSVKEYLVEVRGNSAAWLTHPRRMLRHKAMIQCARLAFGLVGVCDSDEADTSVLADRQDELNGMRGSRTSEFPMPKHQIGPLGSMAVKSALVAGPYNNQFDK